MGVRILFYKNIKIKKFAELVGPFLVKLGECLCGLMYMRAGRYLSNIGGSRPRWGSGFALSGQKKVFIYQ